MSDPTWPIKNAEPNNPRREEGAESALIARKTSRILAQRTSLAAEGSSEPRYTEADVQEDAV